MPLEYFTPQFEKVNVFCSPPGAGSTYYRTLGSADRAQKNVIQLWEDTGQEGGSWERGAYVRRRNQKSVDLYDQGSIT